MEKKYPTLCSDKLCLAEGLLEACLMVSFVSRFARYPFTATKHVSSLTTISLCEISHLGDFYSKTLPFYVEKCKSRPNEAARTNTCTKVQAMPQRGIGASKSLASDR